MENPVSKQHNVASDQGLHCLPMTFFKGFPVKNELRAEVCCEGR